MDGIDVEFYPYVSNILLYFALGHIAFIIVLFFLFGPNLSFVERHCLLVPFILISDFVENVFFKDFGDKLRWMLYEYFFGYATRLIGKSM